MKMVLANVVGYMISTMLFTLITLFFVVTIGATVAYFSDSSDVVSASIEEKTVLVVNVEGSIEERTTSSDQLVELFADDRQPVMSLFDMQKALEKAKTDEKISGVYLRLRWVSSSWASVEALRKMLEDFKSSGKFIYAYSEAYNEKLYYLASAATRIYLYPQGDFEWNGLNILSTFFKKGLDKLKVKPILFRAGEYKSAGEPFVRESMSDENRFQLSQLTNSLWRHVVKTVSTSRADLSVEALDQMAETLSVSRAQEALQNRLVDELITIEDLEVQLKELVGVEAEEDLQLVSPNAYVQSKGFSSIGSKDKIAVLFATGEVLMGKGDAESKILSDEFSVMIRKLAKDEDVKAVVLRVNSPGGSALASDVIWNSLEHLKSKGKPLVSSFSDVAASGGYYIAAGSDFILAEPTTITGSIGVFGLLFQTHDFFNDKLGLNFDGVRTHASADMMTGRQLTNFERQYVQRSVDHVYETFLNVVREGRSQLQTRDDVDQLAQGRVWTGLQALNNGLVDGLGSLNDAVLKAAELSELKDYDVVAYPRARSWYEKIAENFGPSALFKKIQAWVGIDEQILPKASLKGSKRPNEWIHTRMSSDFEIQ